MANLKDLTPYRQIAYTALVNWGIAQNEQEAIDMATNLSFNELEGKVYAKSSIDAALNRIAELTGKDIDQLKEAVYADGDIYLTKDTQEILKQTNNFNIGDAISVLDAVHVNWIKDYFASKFNKEGRENKRYQHLPTQLIGWQETSADLVFVKPILEAMGLEVNIQDLEQAYNAWALEYAMDNKILNTNLQIDNKRMGEYIKVCLNRVNEATGANVEISDKALLDTVRQAKEKQGFSSLKEFEEAKNKLSEKNEIENKIEFHTAYLEAKLGEYKGFLKENNLNDVINVINIKNEYFNSKYNELFDDLIGDPWYLDDKDIKELKELRAEYINMIQVIETIEDGTPGSNHRLISKYEVNYKPIDLTKVSNNIKEDIKHINNIKKYSKIHGCESLLKEYFDERIQTLKTLQKLKKKNPVIMDRIANYRREIEEAEAKINTLEELPSISTSEIINSISKYQNKEMIKEIVEQQNNKQNSQELGE